MAETKQNGTNRDEVEVVARDVMGWPRYDRKERPDADVAYDIYRETVVRGARFYVGRTWDFMFDSWNPFSDAAADYEVLVAVRAWPDDRLDAFRRAAERVLGERGATSGRTGWSALEYVPGDYARAALAVLRAETSDG